MALQSSITVPVSVAKKIRDMHKKYEPRMLLSGFVEELMDNYEKTHCPECTAERPITIDTCSCKAPERV